MNAALTMLLTSGGISFCEQLTHLDLESVEATNQSDAVRVNFANSPW